MTKNFTPIDFLLKKPKKNSLSSLKSKEAEPITKTNEGIIIKETAEHQIEKEVQPFISPRQETIELPPDVKKLGVNPIQTSRFSSYQNIKLPLSDDKILTGLKAPVSSSFRWLATLALYILKSAHLQLKKIHGQIIRIKKE